MKKSTNDQLRKKLALEASTLRILSSGQLEIVAGGGAKGGSSNPFCQSLGTICGSG